MKHSESEQTQNLLGGEAKKRKVEAEESDNKGVLLFRFVLVLIGGTAITLFVCLLEETVNPSPPACSSNVTQSNQVLKPVHDANKYKYVVLKNGMRVMLVNWPYDHSGIGMCIGAGSMANPVGYDGMAHYTEHAIFSGSKHFPSPGYLVEFVNRNDGYRNAFTSMSTTVYQMYVKSDQIAKAARVLGDTMKHPLWNTGHINREKISIQNELDKAATSSNQITYQIGQYLGDPSHPFTRFDMGSKMLFDKKNYIPGIKAFHNKYYKVQSMTAVIFGSQTLDKLEYIAKEELEDIKSSKTPMPTYFRNPYPKKYVGQEAYFARAGADDSLTLMFSLAWTKEQMEELRKVEFIVELISFGKPGSLEAKLKAAGLAWWVSASADRTESCCVALHVTISLTKKGTCARDKVIKEFFTYIEFLKGAVNEALWKAQHDEAKFKFDHASTIASAKTFFDGCDRLLHRDPRWFLGSPDPDMKYDQKLVDYFLGMVRPDNVNVVLELDDDTLHHLKCSLKVGTGLVKRYCPNYDAVYYVQHIPDKWIKSWETPDKQKSTQYSIKPREITVPQNIKVLPFKKTSEPSILLYQYGTRVFWQQTGEEPKIKTSVAIHFGEDYSAWARVMLDMKTAIALEKIQKHPLVQSTLGFTVTIKPKFNAVILALEGYSDYNLYSNLTDTVFRLLTEPVTLTDRQYYSIQSKISGYYLKNEDEKETVTSNNIVLSLFRKSYISRNVLYNAAYDIKKRDVEKTNLFQTVAVKSIITGNINKTQANSLSTKILATFRNNILSDNMVSFPNSTMLPHGRYLYQTEAANPEDINNFVSITWQLAKNDVIRGDLNAQILGAILQILVHSQAYPELRSRQQIGYYVNGQYYSDCDVDYFTFGLQGSRYDANEMTKRALRFFEVEFRDYLKRSIQKGNDEYKDPEDWFDRMISLAIEALEENEHTRIYSRWPYFNKSYFLEIAGHDLNKEDLLHMYDDMIIHGRTLIIQIYPHHKPYLRPSFECKRITNLQTFKKSLKTWYIKKHWK